jgi:hypothetical protein
MHQALRVLMWSEPRALEVAWKERARGVTCWLLGAPKHLALRAPMWSEPRALEVAWKERA